MPINDSATLVVNSGNYFTAPPSTAMPAVLTTVTTPWASVGHTSLQDILSISSEGGDATTLGTLQNKSLRTKYSARQDSFAITLQQFDTAGLKLYYGANAIELSDGSLGVPTEPEPTIAAFLAVFLDGAHVFGFYAPKAELYRADDVSLSDTESLAGLPISIKPLAVDGNDWTYAVTPLGSV